MEEWRDIPGYEGLYKIYLLKDDVKCWSNISSKFLSNRPHNGRIKWNLTKNKVFTGYQAAKWVAFTFPELVQNEYFEGANIDHIDTNPLNNQPYNLRWVTPKENSNNPLTKIHLSESQKGEKSYWYGKKRTKETRNKMSQSQSQRTDWIKAVAHYSKNGALIKQYTSIKAASDDTGIPKNTISRWVSNKNKPRNGDTWKTI